MSASAVLADDCRQDVDPASMIDADQVSIDDWEASGDKEASDEASGEGASHCVLRMCCMFNHVHADQRWNTMEMTLVPNGLCAQCHTCWFSNTYVLEACMPMPPGHVCACILTAEPADDDEAAASAEDGGRVRWQPADDEWDDDQADEEAVAGVTLELNETGGSAGSGGEPSGDQQTHQAPSEPPQQADERSRGARRGCGVLPAAAPRAHLAGDGASDSTADSAAARVHHAGDAASTQHRVGGVQ